MDTDSLLRSEDTGCAPLDVKPNFAVEPVLAPSVWSSLYVRLESGRVRRRDEGHKCPF